MAGEVRDDILPSETKALNPASPYRVHGALLTVAVLFSLNYILGKIALREIQPLALAWVRVTGSAALLLLIRPFIRSRVSVPLTRKDLPAIVLFSMLGVVLNQVLFISGLARTTAHEAAILITTIPVFTIGAAILLKKETAGRWKVAGILFAALGALLVVGGGSDSQSGALLGNVMVLSNCACYALYLVVSKAMVQRVDAFNTITWLFVAGAFLMLPFSLASLLSQPWRTVSPASWYALLAIIAGPTVVAYVLSGWALKHTESSVVAAYTYFQPFIASVLAFLLLGEELSRVDLLGGGLIFVGVYLSTRSRRTLTVSSV